MYIYICIYIYHRSVYIYISYIYIYIYISYIYIYISYIYIYIYHISIYISHIYIYHISIYTYIIYLYTTNHFKHGIPAFGLPQQGRQRWRCLTCTNSRLVLHTSPNSPSDRRIMFFNYQQEGMASKALNVRAAGLTEVEACLFWTLDCCNNLYKFYALLNFHQKVKKSEIRWWFLLAWIVTLEVDCCQSLLVPNHLGNALFWFPLKNQV